jgi:hypothetical protein
MLSPENRRQSTLETQTRNNCFVETGFIGRPAFVFDLYPVTNNDLWSYNRFLFQGNVVKIHGICIDFYRLLNEYTHCYSTGTIGYLLR